jgi:hypothetical protein
MTYEHLEFAINEELDRRAGRTPGNHMLASLTPTEQTELDSLLNIADLLWEANDDHVPTLE